MSLTIEDGTGVNGADSFATGAEYVDFLASYFGETVTADEPALRRAFGFMRSLDWIVEYPTFGGAVPAAVKEAQIMFARIEAQKLGALQPTVTPGQNKVLVGVDSLRWQVTGRGGVDAQRHVVLMAMDRLKGLVESRGAFKFLDRA